MTQIEKGQRFRVLHEGPTPFVIPNPANAGMARLLAQVGFQALATTSGGVAFSLGRRDGPESVSRDETLEHAREIVDATDLPVSADLQNCFGASPKGVAETIRLAHGVGLAGGSIEDATGDPQAPIYEFSLALERSQAAIEAARSLSSPFTLTVRAENFLHGRRDLDDTIKRLVAFSEAGADVLFAPGLPDMDAIKAVCSAVSPKPVNVLVGRSELTVTDLAAAGVRRISVGSALTRAAFTAFLRAAQEIAEAGTFTWLDDTISFADLSARMG